MEYLSIIYIDRFESDEYINMKSLNFRFWKFFSEYSMLFPERKMDSDFSFMKIDISQGSSCRYRRIETESEFTHHHFTFVLHHPVIEFLKSKRVVRRGKYSPILYNQFKWIANFDRKILTRICINQAFSVHI